MRPTQKDDQVQAPVVADDNSASFFADHSATLNESTRKVQAIVFAVISEYHQVRVHDAAGNTFALNRATQGVDLLSLQEGQMLRCEVTLELPRVLRAEKLS